MSNHAENKTMKYEFKAEMKQLLNLIIHSLYTHPEVFLRELVSNSSDALNKVRFLKLTNSNILNKEDELKIEITLDKENNTFSIEDNGIGMTLEDLQEKLGTVASSGTLEFLKTAKSKNERLDGNLIGKFGVGFYSVFMVTEEVTVETRYANTDSQAFIWKSDGSETYIIEESPREKRGTKITFKLKDEHKEFADDLSVKSTIRKYSNFVDFPLFVNGEKVNTITALWHRKKEDLKDEELNEFFKFVSNDYADPLGHLHLDIEGAVNFKALIFIPSVAPMNLFADRFEKSLQLYSGKIFIKDDAGELLPDYLKFLKGVVDTEDLPLNVSREVTQNSPLMAKIRQIVTNKVLSLLEEWAENDKNKFETFSKNFGSLFKTGINQDFTNKDKIIELVRFESTAFSKGELTGFKDYMKRMRDDQSEIYYISGQSRDSVEKNPNLEYFMEKEIEVLLFTDPVDLFTIPYINEYEGKKIVSIEKADLDINKVEKEDSPDEDATKSLIDVFKETLGDEVEDVRISRRLVSSPATLVVGEQGMDAQMEKMMQMLDKEFKGSKKILEINPSHQLIKNLSGIYLSDSKSTLLRECIQHLYEGSLLIEGQVKSPDEFFRHMTDIMVQATK